MTSAVGGGPSSARPSRNTRPTRTDARRNRAHILDVAEQVFASDGLEVSMDAIAKRAGVGAGTLYRHFPNRDALVAGVLEGRQPDLSAEAAAIEKESGDSGAALERWLDAVSRWMRAYEGLPEPLRTALGEQDSPLRLTCQEVIDTTGAFLEAAQGDGHARESLTGRNLYLATLSMAWALGTPSADGSTREELNDLLRSGWRTDL